jgi:hypothetical protein
MPATRLKFSEFVDALLVRLYELDRAALEPGFFNLDQVAKQLAEAVPTGWVFDAAKVLENRGFANCLYTFGGVSAELTGEGRLYVEEGRGITKEIQGHPEAYFHVSVVGNGNQIATGNANQVKRSDNVAIERAPTFALLDQIESSLAADESIGSAKEIEASTYLKLIRIQLEKPQPDLSLIAAVLDPLTQIPSIAARVANLAKLLNR